MANDSASPTTDCIASVVSLGVHVIGRKRQVDCDGQKAGRKDALIGPLGGPSSYRPLSGRYLIPETAGDIWIMPKGGDAEPFVATRFEEGWARFSRDGRFIAYASNESGRFEVYVQPYPVGQRVTISTEGGVEPVWSPDGRELFYRQGDTMMIVDVSTAAEFQAGRPRELFVGRYEADTIP